MNDLSIYYTHYNHRDDLVGNLEIPLNWQVLDMHLRRMRTGDPEQDAWIDGVTIDDFATVESLVMERGLTDGSIIVMDGEALLVKFLYGRWYLVGR